MAAIAINCPLCSAQLRGSKEIALLRYARHLRKCGAFLAACKEQKADPVASVPHLVKLARESYEKLQASRAQAAQA